MSADFEFLLCERMERIDELPPRSINCGTRTKSWMLRRNISKLCLRPQCKLRRRAKPKAPSKPYALTPIPPSQHGRVVPCRSARTEHCTTEPTPPKPKSAGPDIEP